MKKYEEVYNIIEELNLQNSDKYKESILLKYKEVETFKSVLEFTYNPQIKFHLKKIPEYTPLKNITDNNKNDMDIIFIFLNKLINNEISGNRAIEVFTKTLESVTENNAILLEMIITKNLEIGIGSTMLNKVFGSSFIPKLPYCRCSTISKIDKVSYPAIVQTKEDGAFINIVVDEVGEVQFYTRNGNEVELPSIKEEVHSLGLNNVVFHGEIMSEYTDLDNRALGNGRVNSLINKKQVEEKLRLQLDVENVQEKRNKILNELITKQNEWEDTDNASYVVVWDIITLNEFKAKKSNTSYFDRFNSLDYILGNAEKCTKVKLVDGKIVNTLSEAMEFYNEQIGKGLEGAVLKDYKSDWGNKTSTTMVKLKPKFDLELTCIGWEYGAETGAYKEGIGTLICETSDRLFQLKISGLTQADRGLEPVDTTNASKGLKVIEGFDFNKYIGELIQIEHYGVTRSKKKGEEVISLQFAQYKGIRNDKNEVDTLQYILEQK